MAEKANHVRKLREAQLMSKAELARKAGLSPLTIDRVEAGKPSRMDTKRKIILALGYKLSDRHKVFPEEPQEGSASEQEPQKAKPDEAAGKGEAAKKGEAAGSDESTKKDEATSKDESAGPDESGKEKGGRS